MTGNNLNLDLVNINAHTTLGQILLISSRDIEQKLNRCSSVTNERKIMCNNLNVDHVSINAYTKFGKTLSICSKDIEQ